MPSLIELIERVNKGETVEPVQLKVYQDSCNSAERFLSHHAQATLELRKAQQHMMQSLEAIEYSDQKVLNQFIGISSFLGLGDLRAGPVVKFGACAIARREYALGLEAIQNGVSFDIQQGGSWSKDRQNCELVAQQYERAAEAIGWSNARRWDGSNEQITVALIVSSIADDDASARLIRGLAKYYEDKRFKL